MSDKSIYAKLKRCLKGDSRDAWYIIIYKESQTQLELGNYLTEWMEGEIGTVAYKTQVKYLKNTTKPNNVDTKKWINKVRNINTFCRLMSSKAVKLTDTELLDNIPSY